MKFATGSADDELDQLLGDLRFEPFRVSLVDPDDVGDDAAVLRIRVDVQLRGAAARFASPRRLEGVPPRVVAVAGFDVMPPCECRTSQKEPTLKGWMTESHTLTR